MLDVNTIAWEPPLDAGPIGELTGSVRFLNSGQVDPIVVWRVQIIPIANSFVRFEVPLCVIPAFAGVTVPE